MKIRTIVLTAAGATMFAACSSQQAQVSNTAVPPVPTKSAETTTVTSHSTEKSAPMASNSAPTMGGGGSPNAQAVDVSAMTKKIDAVKKELEAKPTDEKIKKALAAAYFERAFALTKAAQYKSALGDFRKGLKLDDSNKEAKDMHDQIIDIYKSIGREPPKEGEEPEPMSVKQ